MSSIGPEIDFLKSNKVWEKNSECTVVVFVDKPTLSESSTDKFTWSWVASQGDAFFTTEVAKVFFPCWPSTITRSCKTCPMGWNLREFRFNLFGALYSKQSVPTCFAISGYPRQWVEIKRRWPVTQDETRPYVDDTAEKHELWIEDMVA